jgi:hypothetical protein
LKAGDKGAIARVQAGKKKAAERQGLSRAVAADKGKKARDVVRLSKPSANRKGQSELFDITNFAAPLGKDEAVKLGASVDKIEKKREKLKRELAQNPNNRKSAKNIARLRVLSSEQKELKRQLAGEGLTAGQRKGTSKAKQVKPLAPEVEGAKNRLLSAKGSPTTFKNKEIEIKQRVAGVDGTKKVKAATIGDWAVESGTSKITHAPTGTHLTSAQTNKSAKAIAKRLAESGVTYDQDNPAKSLTKISKALTRSVKGVEGSVTRSGANVKSQADRIKEFFRESPDGKLRKFKAEGRNTPTRKRLASELKTARKRDQAVKAAAVKAEERAAEMKILEAKWAKKEAEASADKDKQLAAVRKQRFIKNEQESKARKARIASKKANEIASKEGEKYSDKKGQLKLFRAKDYARDVTEKERKSYAGQAQKLEAAYEAVKQDLVDEAYYSKSSDELRRLQQVVRTTGKNIKRAKEIASGQRKPSRFNRDSTIRIPRRIFNRQP